MKITSLVQLCATIIGLALAQPAIAQSRMPTDTGNMAYPEPLPQGNLSTTVFTAPARPTDTGGVARPIPAQPSHVTASNK